MGAKMSKDNNAVNWFDISVADMDRAKKFYETIFEIELKPVEAMGMRMAFFPADGSSGTVGGDLVQGPMHKPSSGGTIIYLNANPDLQLVLNRVEAAGGKINMPKTQINPEAGYMSFISDTEGNTIGLHSNE